MYMGENKIWYNDVDNTAKWAKYDQDLKIKCALENENYGDFNRRVFKF